MSNLIRQVSLHLFLVHGFLEGQGDIRGACSWVRPSPQGGNDVILLGLENASANTPFVEPVSVLRLTGQWELEIPDRHDRRLWVAR
jgi:hypothetical protein